MALDNAEFISELSITDPPGTDPINQGDDHIRTTKRATQQSFPNVDAPVPQTAAQMAQMAIKNEANTFTQVNIFNSDVTFGGVAQQFPDDRMYFRGTATPSPTARVGFSIRREDNTRVWETYMGNNDDYFLCQRRVGGVFQDNPITVSNSSGFVTFAKLSFFNGGMLTIDGSVGTPSYAFNSETNSGMFLIAPGQLAFGTQGRTRLKLNNDGRNSFLQASATGGVSLSLEKNTSIIAYSIDFEGTSGFQPGQFSISRFNRTTGAFIDIPLYINATTGRVHSLLPILSP